MSRGYKTRLSDVLQSIQKIETYLMHINRDAFLSGSTETDAILYQLIVIGEAVKNVPDEIRDKYPEIGWRRIAGLRDVLAHEYFRMNLDIIWNIANDDLRELKSQISQILERESDGSDETPP